MQPTFFRLTPEQFKMHFGSAKWEFKRFYIENDVAEFEFRDSIGLYTLLARPTHTDIIERMMKSDDLIDGFEIIEIRETDKQGNVIKVLEIGDDA